MNFEDFKLQIATYVAASENGFSEFAQQAFANQIPSGKDARDIMIEAGKEELGKYTLIPVASLEWLFQAQKPATEPVEENVGIEQQAAAIITDAAAENSETQQPPVVAAEDGVMEDVIAASANESIKKEGAGALVSLTPEEYASISDTMQQLTAKYEQAMALLSETEGALANSEQQIAAMNEKLTQAETALAEKAKNIDELTVKYEALYQRADKAGLMQADAAANEQQTPKNVKKEEQGAIPGAFTGGDYQAYLRLMQTQQAALDALQQQHK